MDFELENLWMAMKGTRYSRVLEKLRNEIMQSRDLEDALRITLNQVVEAVHAVAGTLWYYDRFGDGLIRPSAVYGGSDLSGIVLHPGEGIAGQVIASGSPTIIADCQKDERWAGRVDARTGFQTRTMICVPLKWHNETFGSIQIINKADRTAYDEKDLLFVQDIAARVAEAFEQRGLLREYVAREEQPEVPPQPEPQSIGLEELLAPSSFADVEAELRNMEFFQNLTGTNQKNVLRHLREIWIIYQRT